tara:strand:+ start:118398 stop:118766 length:369 start_codon:yes stop_codon:yes gene_type:complete
MQTRLESILTHIMIISIVIFVPAQFAVYIFAVFYIMGIFINIKKDKELADAKNTKTEAIWWEILGTSPTAGVAECARVRKLLTKIYHPDGGQAPNEFAMRRINKAFESRAALPDTSHPQHIN